MFGEHGSFPLYRGFELFNKMWRTGKIKPATIIRIHDYGRPIDPHYLVNRKGLLVEIGADNPEKLEPRNVLSRNAAPDGWEIVDYRIDLLDLLES